MTIKDKLLEYSKYKGYSVNAFCKKMGISGSFFARNSGITTDILEEILHKCEDLNPDWLLTGNGEMLRNRSDSISENRESSIINDEHIKSLIEILNRTLIEKDKQIEKLLHIIENKKC